MNLFHLKMEDPENILLKELDEELKKEITQNIGIIQKNQKKIIDSLNNLGQQLFLNEYNVLKISPSNFLFAFQFAKVKYNVILENLVDKSYSFEYLFLMIFDMFFFDLNNFNYENLDDKIYCFQTILDTMSEKSLAKEAIALLKKYSKRKIYIII